MMDTIVTTDTIAMTGDPTVTTVDRIETIGTETDLIEAIGHTATTIGAIGTTTLTIVRGADLAIVLGITVVACIMTKCWTTRVASR